MPEILSTIVKTPFVLTTYDNGDTTIAYAGFSDVAPCQFKIPDLVVKINGEEVLDRSHWDFIPLDDGQTILETEVGGLTIRAGHTIHAIHNTPLRILSVINKSNVVKTNIDVEFYFQLRADSPYAVFSSSDNLAAYGNAGDQMEALFTIPEPVSVSPDSLAHVSSLVFRKHQRIMQDALDLPAKFRKTPYFENWRDGVFNVNASPAYRFTCTALEPGQYAGLSITHWFLRTLTDSCGFSGIAYVIPQNDWKAALICMSAPTHIRTRNLVVQAGIGLLSPIDFYEQFAVDSIMETVENLSSNTNISMVYVIPPESTPNEQIKAVHDQVKSQASVEVLSVPDIPRFALAYKLRESINELLAAGPLANAPEETNCVAIGGDISVALLNAARYGKGDIVPVSDVDSLVQIIEYAGYETVSLVGYSSAFEKLLRDMLEQNSISISIEHIEVEDETAWAFRDAARQTIVNAVLSIFILNNAYYLVALEELYRASLKLNGFEIPDDLRLALNPNFFAEVATAAPEQTVRSIAYAAIGPPALVLGVLERVRWHDAVMGANFSRAKKSPVFFLELNETLVQKFLTDIRRLDTSVAEKDSQEIDRNLNLLSLEQFGEAMKRALLHLPRKALTIFSPRGELSWELLSWGAMETRILVGRYFDVGRMGGGTGLSTARAVWRSLSEAHEPMFSMERVLFAWDSDVDDIVGDALEESLKQALHQGFSVDLLVPSDRLERILNTHAGLGNLLIREAATKTMLLELLGRESYAMVFLAAHGGEPTSAGLLEFSDEMLFDYELPAMSGYPVMMLNSCWTGRAVYDDVEGRNAGIAIELLDRGAFQVLAPTYPVSGRSAMILSQRLLIHGLTRSAARVLRQLKQDVHAPADILWFVAYGDATATKFFGIDGIAEMEDIAEKVPKIIPSIEFDELSPDESRQVIDIWLRQATAALERAKIWGASALHLIEANEAQWGSIGKTLRQNAEVDYERVSAIVDRSQARLNFIAEQLHKRVVRKDT